MLRQKTKIGLWTAALLTGAVGIVNLLSAVTPSLPERVEWLSQIFPFEVRARAHLFAAISGFFGVGKSKYDCLDFKISIEF